MGRTTASAKFRTQVRVYFSKIHSKCASQPKSAKNSLKPIFWGFKVVQGHRCWHHWKACRQCLLW